MAAGARLGASNSLIAPENGCFSAEICFRSRFRKSPARGCPGPFAGRSLRPSVASVHCTSAALRPPGFACCRSPLKGMGIPALVKRVSCSVIGSQERKRLDNQWKPGAEATGQVGSLTPGQLVLPRRGGGESLVAGRGYAQRSSSVRRRLASSIQERSAVTLKSARGFRRGRRRGRRRATAATGHANRGRWQR